MAHMTPSRHQFIALSWVFFTILVCEVLTSVPVARIPLDDDPDNLLFSHIDRDIGNDDGILIFNELRAYAMHHQFCPEKMSRNADIVSDEFSSVGRLVVQDDGKTRHGRNDVESAWHGVLDFIRENCESSECTSVDRASWLSALAKDRIHEQTTCTRRDATPSKDSAQFPEQMRLMTWSESTLVVSFVVWEKWDANDIALIFLSNRSTEAAVSSLFRVTNVTVTTYTAGTLFPWSGWNVHVTVQFTPASDSNEVCYPYSVEYAGLGFSNPGWYFCPRTGKDTVHIGVYGDMGTVMPSGWKVVRQMNETVGTSLDMVCIVGDLAYAGTGSKEELEYIWDVWGRIMETLGGHIPIATVVGNHEKYFNYSSYRDRFRMPNYDVAQNMFWTRTVGPVQLVAFSSEHDYTPGSVQYVWMESVLSAVDRKQTPWVILMCHRPMYASDLGEFDQTGVGSHLQQNIEPLLEKYSIDVMLTGHHHIYERTTPIRNGYVVMRFQTIRIYGVDPQGTHYYREIVGEATGTVHVCQGTGGAYYEADSWISPLPAWSISRTYGVYGYGHFIATGTNFAYEYRQDNGELLDSFIISKQ